MNAKITLVELSELMAKSTSTSRKVCELFLRELFATISQSLINGESVKVKGVGTFKISQVKPRKSVDVSSGEAIQLSGHKRLTFTPDKSLAETVNQPFAQFETVYLDDAVTDEQLAEIDKQYPSLFNDNENGTPSDSQGLEPVAAAAAALAGAGDKGADEPGQGAPLHEATAQQPEPEPVSAVEPEPAPEPEPVSAVEPEPAPEPEPVPEPADNPEPEAPEQRVAPAMARPIDGPGQSPAALPPDPQDQGTPERKPMLVGIPIDGPSQPVPEPEPEEETDVDSHFYRPEPRNAYTPTPEQIEEASRRPKRPWLWIVLGVLALGLLAWAVTRCGSDGKADVSTQHEVVASDTLTDEQVEQIEAEAAKEKAAKEKAEKAQAEKAKAELEKAAKAETENAAQAEKQAKSDKNGPQEEVTDVVTSQIVLTTLSEKHYGSPWFWVYIYEENVARGIINDPNNIRPGTRVVIPPASKYGIDPKDKAALRKAQIKSMEYLKGR